MVFKEYKDYRKSAINALDRELRLRNSQPQPPAERPGLEQTPSRRFIAAEKATHIAKQNLLSIRALREQTGCYITDQDRAIVNEAIRAKLELKHIELLLEDYPNACESGGCVDHVDHPIHNACIMHRHAVPAIIKSAPDCANQRNKDGKLPLELYLDNSDMTDITSAEFASTMNKLAALSPRSAKEIFSKTKSVKQQVLLKQILPRHLKNCIFDPPSLVAVDEESRDSHS